MHSAANPLVQVRHRLVVCTDLTSATTGVREPDDAQSLIRLLLYSEVIDLEGILAGSNLHHGQVTRPELAHQLIDAYSLVRGNLVRHDPRYPHPDDLHALVQGGQAVAEPHIPVMDSIGAGRDTAASRALIDAVDRPDHRPLWVSLWGGGADLAQALWRVAQDRTPDAAAAFRAKLRVHAINDQDSTCAWMRESFPDLFYITRTGGYRGMYRGGAVHLANRDWVTAWVHGRGALGDAYPCYDGGDPFGRTLGPITGIKEGDTPSFLGLVPNGLHHPEALSWGGWGGRLRQTAPLRWTCAVDEPESSDPLPEASTVRRWRPAFQADFAARLRRCTEQPGAIPLAPTLIIEGPLIRSVSPGEQVELHCAGDAHATWQAYRSCSDWCTDLQVAGPRLRLTVPDDANGDLHLWVESGTAPDAPRSYARCVLRVG